ncbi:MAG: hypothetical protein AAF430_14970 [Myxococcota bacterium]
MSRPVAKVLSALSAGVAVVALIVGAWSASQFRSATLARPWFVAPHAIAAAPDATLFVAVQRFEIQAYASDGTPIRAWRFAPPGQVRLQFSDDVLEVAYPDSERVLRFGADGSDQGQGSDSGAYERFGAEGERSVLVGDAHFVLEAEGLVRVTPAPRQLLVPAPPAPLGFFGERPLLPVTGVLLLAPLGMAASIAFGRHRPD